MAQGLFSYKFVIRLRRRCAVMAQMRCGRRWRRLAGLRSDAVQVGDEFADVASEEVGPCAKAVGRVDGVAPADRRLGLDVDGVVPVGALDFDDEVLLGFGFAAGDEIGEDVVGFVIVEVDEGG
jgi:hypothetical protein